MPTTPQTIGSLSIMLLTNREGVRKWLSKFGQSSPSLITASSTSASQFRATPSEKPSVSDILRLCKENDITSDWEEVSPEKARTPTGISGTFFFGKTASGGFSLASASGIFFNEDTQKNPRASKIARSNNMISSFPAPLLPSSFSLPPRPLHLSQPSPLLQSLGFPYRTTHNPTSESSSTMSSRYSDSDYLPEIISRGPRNLAWPSVVDEPPRKLILAAPVLQVVNSNTVKDCFLILFSHR